MSVTMQQRGDTAANWTAANPVLHQREIGVETDTGKLKIGDGVTAWASLAYWSGGGGGFTNPMTTLGDIMYENATPAAARLAGDTSNTRKFLRTQASGGVAQAPAWDTLLGTDVPAATVTTRGALILSPGVMPWQFYVPWPGAGIDATPALRTALTNAASYMAANQGYAEIWVDPQVYTLSTALTNSGLGNAQLPLPVIGSGVTGGILNIRCTSGNGGANPYFNQTVSQKSGAIFYSTLTGQVNDATFGGPYILGGPSNGTYFYGGSTFNNLMLILDGITFMVQNEGSTGPTMGGVFLGSLAKAQVISGASFPDATVTQMNSTTPSHFWNNGLYMPWPLNNANNYIGTWSGYGMYRGALITSHTTFNRVLALYCLRGAGLLMDADGHMVFGNLSAELCTDALYNEGSSGLTGVNISLDCEQISGNHVNDSGSNLSGQVLLNTNGASVVVNGAANLQVISVRQARAVQSAPSYTLGTAFQNPWWRNATVQISGGTVTGVSVGPTSGSLTSLGITSGTFRLPSGWWVNIAGSVKPTTFVGTLD